MRFTVGLLFSILCFVAIIEGSTSKKPSSQVKIELSSESSEGSEDFEELDFEFAISKDDMKKAWNSARTLTDRNPKIWRVDKQNNIILSSDLTISSPLAFKALIKVSPTGSCGLEAVQEEYFGSAHASNHLNGLKYLPNDTNQDHLLSLIEIALLGNVSDDRGESYCWVPSSIHQDLFKRHDAARRWHMRLFDYDPKYGMAGHNLVFQHMRVALKNIKHFPESVLDSMDQIHTTMYIHNYQSQCSDVVDQIFFPIDSAREAEEIKNNWGLPRVSQFIEPGEASVSTTIRPVQVIKSKKLTTAVTTAAAVNKPKPSSAPYASLSELEWPSLSAGETSKPKVTKKNKAMTNEI